MKNLNMLNSAIVKPYKIFPIKNKNLTKNITKTNMAKSLTYADVISNENPTTLINKFSSLKNILINGIEELKKKGQLCKIYFNQKSITIFKQSKGFGIEKLELPLPNNPKNILINSLNFLKLIRSPLNAFYFKNNKTFFLFEPKIVKMASCIILSQIFAYTYNKARAFKPVPDNKPIPILPETKKTDFEKIKIFLFKLFLALLLLWLLLCILTYILKNFGLIDYNLFEICVEKIRDMYQDVNDFIGECLNHLLTKILGFQEFRELMSMELNKLADRIRTCFKEIKTLQSDLKFFIKQINSILEKLLNDVDSTIHHKVNDAMKKEKEEFLEEVRKAVAKQVKQLMKKEKTDIEKDTIELVHNLSKEYLSQKTTVTDILPSNK